MTTHKRNKSGLHPALFSELTAPEKSQVWAAMEAYNAVYLDAPYFEIEEFYHEIYKRGQALTQPKNTGSPLAAVLGLSGALAVAAGSCLLGNLCFAGANIPLILAFAAAGNRAQLAQFVGYEIIAVSGLALHLGGIV